MTLVVDASAMAAILFGEPDGSTIAAHIDGETLLAPELIDYELANVGWKKIRRHPDRQGELTAAMSGWTHLAITRVRVPVADIVTLAVDTGLSAYDASYLWLALTRDVELVTLDERLARVNQSLREKH